MLHELRTQPTSLDHSSLWLKTLLACKWFILVVRLLGSCSHHWSSAYRGYIHAFDLRCYLDKDTKQDLHLSCLN